MDTTVTYEQALQHYTDQKSSEAQDRAEAQAQVEVATKATLEADKAVQDAIQKKDKAGYKKAMKAKTAATEDLSYYSQLVTRPIKATATDLAIAKRAVSFMRESRDNIKEETEQLIADKILEALDLALAQQLELKKTWWCEMAMRIEVLGDDITYTTWDPLGQQPELLNKILDIAWRLSFSNNKVQKEYGHITKKYELAGQAERDKWGEIGGNDS